MKTAASRKLRFAAAGVDAFRALGCPHLGDATGANFYGKKHVGCVKTRSDATLNSCHLSRIPQDLIQFGIVGKKQREEMSAIKQLKFRTRGLVEFSENNYFVVDWTFRRRFLNNY